MRQFKFFIFLLILFNAQLFVAQTNNAIHMFTEKAKHAPCEVSISWEDIDEAKLQYVDVQEKCIKHIKENANYTSIYLLRALEELRPDALQEISSSTRAAIYGSLFNKFRCVDNWVSITFTSNMINIEEKPLALEMLALQDYILPYLQQGLEDKRPIFVMNNADGSLSSSVRLEKRDIAYYFIKKLKGQSISIPTNPMARKRNVEAYNHKISLR